MTEEFVRDISVDVYKFRLEQSSPPPGAVQRMLEEDADGGMKLRERAGAYDTLTRAYLCVLGLGEPNTQPYRSALRRAMSGTPE